MSLEIQRLINKVRSGVIHIEYLNNNGQEVGSGSGFLTQGYLVTNHHVFSIPLMAASKIKLSFQKTKDINSIKSICIDMEYWQRAYVSGSPGNNEDFVVLTIPELKEHNLYEFDIGTIDNSELGDKALILGFPFDHKNLVCHEATISSFYKSNNVMVIQLDASVNNSNSGGPLVDIHSGKVIGIITRKGTGLTMAFAELYKSFDQNTAIINAVLRGGAGISIGGLNPVEVLMIGQNQLKILCKEIERSANVGIGYAFSVEYLVAELLKIAKN